MIVIISAVHGARKLRHIWKGAGEGARISLVMAGVTIGAPAFIATGVGIAMGTNDKPGQPSFSDHVAHECKTGADLSGKPIDPARQKFSCTLRPGAWIGHKIATPNNEP